MDDISGQFKILHNKKRIFPPIYQTMMRVYGAEECI